MSEVGALRPLDGVTDLAQLRARLDEQRIGAAPAQARVTNNANLTISNDTLTALTFNTDRWDTGNFHSTSADTSRLTAPTAGLYAIGASLRFAASSTGYRFVGLRLNGSTFIAVARDNAVTSPNLHDLTISTQYQLSAGDYVEVMVQQTSGGNLNVNSAAAFSPEFYIVRLGSQA